MAVCLTARIALLVALLGLAACAETPSKADDEQPIDLAQVYALATRAYDEKNWAESEKHYVTLTHRAPGEAEPWFKLGNIYARTLRPDLAIKAYRETLVRNSQHIKAWHNMAVVQLRQAAGSFAELELLVEPDDDLHEKSVRIQRAIEDLVP